jgi:ubiquinone/menaquinone biosynthesis C-methylase UbiE
MKRVLETDDMREEEIMLAYDNLRTLDLVNDYFLNRALELCPTGKILDVGCGTGKMLRSVQGNYEKHGLDISEKLIEQAREQDSNSRYDVANSNNLPYDSGSFDLVMCHSVLHHLENPNKTIEEIVRVTKPEGAIFVRDLLRPASEEVLQRLFLDYLAGHYDEQNKRLFENSLRSSFTHDEWKGYFPEGIDVSNVFFYNMAERFASGDKVDLQERKSREVDFVLSRLTEPITDQ